MNYLLQTAVAYPCILGILVIVHEWGHFIVARLCSIRVDEFSIGFGPRALRIGKSGDTEYNIRWIPLGGYVKIAGMEPDEAPLLNARDIASEIIGRVGSDSNDVLSKTPLLAENMANVDETAEQRLEDVVDGFYSKPLWQRSLVIFAGPFMSFVFGYLLFCSLGAVVGTPDPNNIIDHVTPGSVAQHIGLKAHDRIIKIDNTVIRSGEQMVGIIHSSDNKVLTLTVQRGNSILIMRGAPKVQPDSGTPYPIFGFSPGATIEHKDIIASINFGNTLTVALFQHLGDLVRRHSLTEFRQSAGGPIFIAQTTYQAVKEGPSEVILLAGEISVSLAIFNLLPIPILDGGHLLLFAVEGFRKGRRLTMQQQQNFVLAGLAIIGVLFVAIMVNDLSRHIPH